MVWVGLGGEPRRLRSVASQVEWFLDCVGRESSSGVENGGSSSGEWSLLSQLLYPVFRDSREGGARE